MFLSDYLGHYIKRRSKILRKSYHRLLIKQNPTILKYA